MVARKKAQPISPWYERAFVILAISILIGIIQNLYSRLSEINTEISHFCQKQDHQSLWQAIKGIQDKQTDILLKIKEIELKGR